MCTSYCSDPSWSFLGELAVVSLIVWIATSAGLFVLVQLDARAFGNFFIYTASSLFAKLNYALPWALVMLSCLACLAFFVIRFYNEAQLQIFAYTELVLPVLLLIYDALGLVSSAVHGSSKFYRVAVNALLPASLSVVSLLLPSAADTWFSLTFLAVTRMGSLWDTLAQNQPKLKQFSKLTDALMTTYLRLCILLTVCCSLLSVVEHIEDPNWLDLSSRAWSLMDALYFVVLCVVTVGSNLSPVSTLGRLITVVALFAGLATLIVGVRQYAAAASIKSSGKGSYIRRRKRCVLITGNPIFDNARDMIQEIFHPDHAKDSADLSVVFVFMPNSDALDATNAFLKLQDISAFSSQVQLFRGNILDAHDMGRVGVDDADTVIVVPCLTTSDPTAEDTENITRIFSLRSRTRENVRIIGLFFRAENKALMDRADLPNVEILSLEDYKMRLIGISAGAAPGFLSLVSILCKTIGELKTEKGGRWRLEYEEGLGSEIYEVPLSSGYRGMTFGDCFVDIFQRSDSVLMLGLIIRTVENDEVLLNPGFDYVIPREGSITGIFIAPRRDLIVQRKQKHSSATEGVTVSANVRHNLSKENECSVAVSLVKYSKGAPAPPAEVLMQGDHTIVCIVGEAPDTVSVRALVEALGVDAGAIVVLSEKLPRDATAAAELGRVFFMKGCPTSVEDLDRLNYVRASRCVILQSFRGPRDQSMTDSEVVLCSLLVRQGSEGRVTIINELSLESSLRQLAKAGENDVEAFEDCEFFRRKTFAQGSVFVASTMASAVANTIFNPSLMTICMELVSKKVTHISGHDWNGRLYTDALRDCIKNGYLPMAICRLLPFSADQRYVYVAPPAKKTTVQSGDNFICIRVSSN